jgi:hypothetical protein
VSDTGNATLRRIAGELLDEIRAGKWEHVAELEPKPPVACDELITELRSRCPGFTRDEYEAAITDGLSAPTPRETRFAWLYWPIAFTFVWAFIVTPLGVKKLWGWSHWVTVFGYPAMCGVAALYLVRAKRGGRIAFALVNAACAIAWMILSIWAFRAFAGNFWK